MPTLRMLPILLLGVFMVEAGAAPQHLNDAHSTAEAWSLPAAPAPGLAEDWPLYDDDHCLLEKRAAQQPMTAIPTDAIAASDERLVAGGNIALPADARAAVAETPPAPSPLFAPMAAVDDETLDGLRGGFEAPGGLRMSFGIERAVYINGVLESTTHLKVADLGQIVAALPTGTTLKVIQNGPGNSIETTLPATLLGTVIQNSLDNQTLRVVNKIDIKVNSAELFSGARMQRSVSDALNRATLAR